jgi:Eukaryotic membrane protein family
MTDVRARSVGLPNGGIDTNYELYRRQPVGTLGLDKLKGTSQTQHEQGPPSASSQDLPPVDPFGDGFQRVSEHEDAKHTMEPSKLPSPPASPRAETIMQKPMLAGNTSENGSLTANTEIEEVLKLSPERLRSLTYSPESLPVRLVHPVPTVPNLDAKIISDPFPAEPAKRNLNRKKLQLDSPLPLPEFAQDHLRLRNLTVDTSTHLNENLASNTRPGKPQRTLSTPASSKGFASPRKAEFDTNRHDQTRSKAASSSRAPLPSPMPSSFPLPPLSIPTYLQLELSSQRPSQLYIHRSANSDFPYESSRVKIERLTNFLLLPLHLEGVLWFGTLACVDAWLYTFTILPLRLLKSFYILGQSWSANLIQELHFVSQNIYTGLGRMWRRRHSKSAPQRKSTGSGTAHPRVLSEQVKLSAPRTARHHQRTKSMPSMLLPDDKADMLKGLLIICTTLVLLRFDASKMYHWVRGQAAIKLYVIYNILEVCDRLFSAIGQDVLECLFSREALERKPDGHSKILRPFWLFMLALAYTVIHSTALFYQVITLNVAVNAYSNALITLLLSNQFVEIKGTVFKKFEKENLFQLTCADVVERFQLWHMLIIIASRNIVETGDWSRGFTALTSSSVAMPTNTSVPVTAAVPPRTMSSILPRSFTLVPEMFHSLTLYAPLARNIIGPFIIVLGSEMLVDWLKHAYINKFNNTRPAIYDRFLDVLAKDYYTNAFGDQNLTKRLGLPVIPLSCLLIRACVQTYHMFVAAWGPSAPASTTGLASIQEHYTSSLGPMPTSTTASISRKMDELLRALPSSLVNSEVSAQITTVLVLMLVFLVLLACKLVLGMLLLSFSRARYRTMKEREKNPIHHIEGGRRVGGWGVVEVDQDKRRWIYEDDEDGLRVVQDREDRDKAKRERDKEKGVGLESFDKVKRYEMVAKRIW